MTRKIMLGLIVLAIGLLTMPAYTNAEILSPLKQFNMGVPLNMIECSADKILLQSPSKKPVCLTEDTADKLIDRGYSLVVLKEKTLLKENIEEKINIKDNNELTTQKTNENNTLKIITENKLSSQITVPDDDLNTIPISDEIENPKFGSKHNKELEKIPNPDGYWVPIVDKDAFAEHFLSVVGDEIIETDDVIAYTEGYYSGNYDTVDGSLTILNNHFFPTGDVVTSVRYVSTDTAYDVPKQIEYINNFMNKMGFKMNGNDVALSESLVNNYMELAWTGNFCKTCAEDGLDIRIIPWNKYYTKYYLNDEYSSIGFLFNNKAYYTYSELGMEIKFDGWTNHPELIKTTMDQKNRIDGVSARQAIYDFALNNEELNKSHRDGGRCEFEVDDEVLGISLNEDFFDIVSGVPYHVGYAGHCTYDPNNTGHAPQPAIAIDVWTGDSIFITYRAGLD